MQGFLRQSTASQTRTIGPFISDADFKTVDNGLTIANTDIRLKKNGAADVAKNSGGATADVNGLYAVTWDATDTDTVGELSWSVLVSGALLAWGTYVVLEEAVYDALFAASAPGYVANAPVNVAQWAGSNVATPSVAGVPEVDLTHIEGVAQSATDLKDFADAGYDPSTNKVQGVVLVDTLTTYTGNTPQTGDNFARLGAPAGASVSADIAAVKAQTAAIEADTQDIQSRLPAALTGAGNIKADALVVSDKTGYAIGVGGINAAAFAAGAVDAAALAADAVAEIQAGLATAANLATLQTTANNIETDTQDIQNRIPAALVGGRIDANMGAVSGDATAADTLELFAEALDQATGQLDAGSFATGAFDAVWTVAARSLTDKAGFSLSAAGIDAIWDEVVDGATTARESFRLANSANGGKTSGAGTGSFTIRDLADTKDRVTATVTLAGDRTAVSRDLS